MKKQELIEYLESLGLTYNEDYGIEEKWLESFLLFMPENKAERVKLKLNGSKYKLVGIGIGFDYNRQGFVNYLKPLEGRTKPEKGINSPE